VANGLIRPEQILGLTFTRKASLELSGRLTDRLRLLREVTLPGRAYMLRSYDVASSPLGSAVLPLLYCHRLVLGGWKVLARRK